MITQVILGSQESILQWYTCILLFQFTLMLQQVNQWRQLDQHGTCLPFHEINALVCIITEVISTDLHMTLQNTLQGTLYGRKKAV